MTAKMTADYTLPPASCQFSAKKYMTAKMTADYT